METNNILSVKELQREDVQHIINYWHSSESSFLKRMGVDLTKIPDRSSMEQMLLAQIVTPYDHKKSYCIIWQHNGKPIGHSNVNPVKYGEEAFMHLHLWKSDLRKKGLGFELVRMTLPYFFENLKLKKIISETYSLNLAPNKTLERIGFTFVKEYLTVPGSINFEQVVTRWELTVEDLKKAKL